VRRPLCRSGPSTVHRLPDKRNKRIASHNDLSQAIHLRSFSQRQGWALHEASSWSEGSVPYQATTGIRHSAQPTTSMPTAITENAPIAGLGRILGTEKGRGCYER
jgi:hypothetical protein